MGNKCKDCGGKIENPIPGKEGVCRKCALKSVPRAYDTDVANDNLIKAMINAGFKDKFSRADLKLWEGYNSKAKDTKDWCMAYLKNYDGKTGFFLHGKGKGIGKTYISACLAKELIKMKKPIMRIHILNMLSSIRMGYNNDHISEQDVVDKYLTKSHLIIDDIGTEKISEWVLQMMNLIINERYERELPTSFTSNLSADEVGDRIDQRISSRMKSMCKMISFDGLEDYRAMKREKA